MHYPSDVLGGVALGLAIGRSGRGSARRTPRIASSTWREAARGPGGEDRHRRPAERRQDDAVQRAHPGGAETAAIRSRPSSPNVAIVAVPDERLAAGRRRRPGRARSSPRRSSSTTSRGWFAAPRRARGSATASSPRSGRPTPICHVVRAHGDERSRTRADRPDPVADAEAVEAELLLADLEQAERRLERVRKQAALGGEGSGRGARLAGARWSKRSRRGVRSAMSRTRPGPEATGAPSGVELEAGPVRGQRRRGEPSARPRSWSRHAGGQGGACIAISARIEAELAELAAEEAAEMRGELGLTEPGPRAPRPRRLRPARAGHLLHRTPRQRGAGAGASARGHRLGRRRQGPRRHPGGLRARRGDRLAGTGRRGRLRRSAGPGPDPHRGPRLRGWRRRRDHDPPLTQLGPRARRGIDSPRANQGALSRRRSRRRATTRASTSRPPVRPAASAIWIRHTVHKRPGRGAHGRALADALRRRGRRGRAPTKASFGADELSAPTGAYIRVDGATLEPGRAAGRDRDRASSRRAGTSLRRRRRALPPPARTSGSTTRRCRARSS